MIGESNVYRRSESESPGFRPAVVNRQLQNIIYTIRSGIQEMKDIGMASSEFVARISMKGFNQCDANGRLSAIQRFIGAVFLVVGLFVSPASVGSFLRFWVLMIGFWLTGPPERRNYEQRIWTKRIMKWTRLKGGTANEEGEQPERRNIHRSIGLS